MEVEQACAEKNLDLLGCTIEKMRESYTCGPHVGSEVLGGAVGSIPYRRLAIEVDRDSSPGLNIEVAGDDDSAPVTVDVPASDSEDGSSHSQGKGAEKDKPQDQARKEKAPQRTVDLPVNGLNRTFWLPGHSAGARIHGLGNRSHVLSHIDNDPVPVFTSLREGSTDVTWSVGHRLYVTKVIIEG